MQPELLRAFLQSPGRLEDSIRDALDDPCEPGFALEVTLCAEQPTLSALRANVDALEERTRLLVLFAFLEPNEIDSYADAEGLLRAHPEMPLKLTALGLSSVKLTIEGDADEIAQFLNKPQPARNWRRRLLTYGAAVLGGFAVGIGAGGLDMPSEQAARAAIERACAPLSAGSEVTIKTPVLDVKVKCPRRGPAPPAGEIADAAASPALDDEPKVGQ